MNTYTLPLEKEQKDTTNILLKLEYLTIYSCEFNWKSVF